MIVSQRQQSPTNQTSRKGTQAEMTDSQRQQVPTSQISQTREQKQQGADRPTEAPSSTEVDAIASKKNQAENAQEGITGTTGHSNTAEHSNTSHTKITSDEERNKLAEKGELPHDPNDHSGEPGKEKGTGEQWVKSSGIAADGGDFDVTKPGAGKEATRLMEEKGIKTEGATFDPDAPKDTTPGVGSSHHDEAAKVSKIAKLKEKLHIGSGKNLDK
ncbi:hypothetical protein EJ08DRAFT_303087 [Tothia fuscella]|uniref:Uncharacterized protein n=1 Tax=Tothia fuscella TaxID=1048955 RepID=A0A9P4TXU0_9PEZI|nr:hypothetical protein EJ08DRAFT_303087 [Tothia fuscella]